MRSSFTASELIEGHEYRIVKEFCDFDGIIHRIDEKWKFRSMSFLPYDDGLSLYVEFNGTERQIRLQWRPDAQSAIIEDFHEYAEEILKSEQASGCDGDRHRG